MITENSEPNFNLSVLCGQCVENDIITEMTGSDKMFENSEHGIQSREYNCKCGNLVTVVLEQRRKQ